MRKMKIIAKYDRRHRWVKLRDYPKWTLYRCRSCGTYYRWPDLNGLMQHTMKAIRPRLIENIMAPNKFFAVFQDAQNKNQATR